MSYAHVPKLQPSMSGDQALATVVFDLVLIQHRHMGFPRQRFPHPAMCGQCSTNPRSQRIQRVFGFPSHVCHTLCFESEFAIPETPILVRRPLAIPFEFFRRVFWICAASVASSFVVAIHLLSFNDWIQGAAEICLRECKGPDVGCRGGKGW